MERLPKLIENPHTVSEHLYNRQMELGISQNEMARRIGVKPENIIYWAKSKTTPMIKFIPKIIAFLGYNPFPVDDKSIGGQIKRYRMEKGLNFRKLAKVTGNDPGTLARWEQNITAPSTWETMRLVVLRVIQ